MRHHIAVKFIAVLLATLSLLMVVGSALGIIGLTSAGLYNISVDEFYESQMEGTRRTFAVNLAHRYASMRLGNCPEAYLVQSYSYAWLYDTFAYGYYYYTIRDEAGNIVESTARGVDLTEASLYTILVTDIRYRSVVQEAASQEADAAPTETQAVTDATMSAEYSVVPSYPPETASAEIHRDGYYDPETGAYVEFAYQYANLPPHSVKLYLLPGAIPEEQLWTMLKVVWQYRMDLFYILAVSLLVFAVCAVWLCCTAGRKPGREAIRPGGLNRLPLDLYGCLTGGGILILISLSVQIFDFLLEGSPLAAVVFAALGGLLCCLGAVSFGFACAAQCKVPGGFWWRHTVIGFLGQKLRRLLSRLCRGGRAVYRMLPILWQWLLAAGALLLWMVLSILLLLGVHSRTLRFLCLLSVAASLVATVGVVCYCAYALGALLKGARYMSQGNLQYQIPTKSLVGPFRDCACHLNSLAGAAQLAAERQLRSERMKTELITNVSHDIKTPLTSIINYVDLLKMPHAPEEDAQYLEVLDRQSQRLKKLVEDLMDMSKASTGNMSVDISRVNAGEAINQALGEFADKLERADLVPIFRSPQEPVFIQADGRLVWRVLSNLLSNAVKYALPGTRLYIDMMELENHVLISLKNISREELNVRAEELLERFVRGDTSRNTEGSGLGLNIAKSLMELQKGQLQLLVDGDLFKVTLVFPAG